MTHFGPKLPGFSGVTWPIAAWPVLGSQRAKAAIPPN
jgi:hypothetical protein